MSDLNEKESTFNLTDFKSVLGKFPSGVTVVTALETTEPVGFTCQSFFSLSLDPPLIAIAPAKSSTSWPRMVKAKKFCVNLMGEDQKTLALSFAVSGGDKFGNVLWHKGRLGTPIIDGSLGVIECELEMIHDAGDHEIVIGLVKHIDSNTDNPLVFFKGAFRELAQND